MEDILARAAVEVEKLANSGVDEKTRKTTINALRELQYALEPPEETMQRLIYTNLTIASVRVSLDLKIFDILSASAKPLSLADLAEKTGADPVLLGRFLRHQASLGIIKEPTKTSSLLQERRRTSRSQKSKPAYTSAWKTDLPIWAWLHKDQRLTTYFNRFMYAQRSSTKNCFSFLPIEEQCKDWPSDKPVFVDVGGGTGQQCVELKAKYPNLPGKVILQDLPAVVAEAEFPDGLEIQKMEYDFFTEQPVKGAKFYYFRAIMHDHADDKCLEILKNTVDSMSEDSIILLDEIVVPDKNVDWYVTQTDLAMMSQFSAVERTEGQWRELLAQAGLSVEEITTYTYAFQLSIIACKKIAR